MTDDGSGQKPIVGILRRSKNTGLALERKEGMLGIDGLKPILAILEKHLDCKVWLVGKMSAKTLMVHKFGWLSCKNEVDKKMGKETTP